MSALELYTQSYWQASHQMLAYGNAGMAQQVLQYTKLTDPRAKKLADAAKGSMAALAERFIKEQGE